MLLFLVHVSKAVLIKMSAVCHGDHFRPSLADWHSTASYVSVHVPVRHNEDYSLELERDSALCAMAVIIL